VQSLWLAPAVALAALWLWFLARGRAPGGLKRLALRLTLLALAVALAVSAAERGLLSRASVGFRIALVLAVVTVTVGYLYVTRFCERCGRMVRNLKVPACPRCGAPLSAHGMTARPRRSGDELRSGGGAQRRGQDSRARHPEGPSA
jgi:hypothetical protein